MKKRYKYLSIIILLIISLTGVVYSLETYNDNVQLTLSPTSCTRGCIIDVFVRVLDNDGNPVEGEIAEILVKDSDGNEVVRGSPRETNSSGYSYWYVSTLLPYQDISPWPAGTYTVEASTVNYGTAETTFTLKEIIKKKPKSQKKGSWFGWLLD